MLIVDCSGWWEFLYTCHHNRSCDTEVVRNDTSLVELSCACSSSVSMSAAIRRRTLWSKCVCLNMFATITFAAITKQYCTDVGNNAVT